MSSKDQNASLGNVFLILYIGNEFEFTILLKANEEYEEMRRISLFSKKSVKFYKKQNDVLNKNNVQLDIPLHENNNAEELQ